MSLAREQSPLPGLYLPWPLAEVACLRYAEWARHRRRCVAFFLRSVIEDRHTGLPRMKSSIRQCAQVKPVAYFER